MMNPLVLSAACLALCCCSFAFAGKPNILLIITDDQGYGDLSIHGNPHLQTPHIDRLGHSGVRFDRFYVNSFCAPTRTALWLQLPSVTNRLVTTGAFPFTPNRQPARGNWIPVNHYVRPHPVFDGLPMGGFMAEAYQNVIPRFTLRDVPGAPLSGCVSWDHNKDYTGPTEVWHGSNLLVMPHGRGRLVLSTFNLIEHLGADPVADKLLLNLCRWLGGETKP